MSPPLPTPHPFLLALAIAATTGCINHDSPRNVDAGAPPPQDASLPTDANLASDAKPPTDAPWTFTDADGPWTLTDADGPWTSTDADVPAPDADLPQTDAGPCDIACKAPDPGKVTVCGHLTDAQAGVAITDAGTGALCQPDAPTSTGPCSIRVRVLDAIQFAANPPGAPMLTPEEIVTNDCGAYMVHNIPTPMLGYLAVITDDAPAGTVNTWKRTATFMPVVPGGRFTERKAYSVTGATDVLWTTNAGSPFGATTFWERGAHLSIFMGPDATTSTPGDLAPVEGVKMLVGNVPAQASAYYFTDSSATSRTSPTPSTNQPATGPNGAALVVDSDLVRHGGVGAEPTDTAPGQVGVACAWPSELSDATPGTYIVTERIATNVNTGDACR